MNTMNAYVIKDAISGSITLDSVSIPNFSENEILVAVKLLVLVFKTAIFS